MYRIFLISILLVPFSSFADEINLEELYRCDPVFCPDGTAVQSPVSRQLRNHIGINPGDPAVQMPNVPRVRIVTRDIRGATIQGRGQSTPPPAADQQTPTASDDPQGQNPGPGQEQGQGQDQGFAGLQQQGQGGQQGAGYQSQQLPNGNTRVGQSIYADDEPETAPIQAGQAAVAPSTYQMPANPVAMNKANDSGGGGSDDGDGPRGGGFQGPQGGGIAANNSPDNSPNPTRASGGSAKSKLSELAASLGTAVEDLQGRIKSGLGFGGPEGRRAGSRNSKGRGPASVQAAKLDEQVIRDRFGRIIRSTASRMEFGRANEPLFKNMCGHYATYAAQNRIPYDRSGCGE